MPVTPFPAAARFALARRLGVRRLIGRELLRRERRRADDGGSPAEAMWRAAAAALGADATRLSPAILEIRLGAATTWIGWEQTTSFTDRVTQSLASDKPTAYRLLSRASLPVPEHVLLPRGDRTAAGELLGRIPPPYLVKPARGTGGGVGVVGHIVNGRDLAVALQDAWRYGDVLLERHLPLPTYRLLLLDGRLLDALRRPLPTVVGTGTATVQDLIVREARRRIACGGASVGASHLEVDLDCLLTLRSANVALGDVPVHGEAVVVSSATNRAAPEEIDPVAQSLHPEVVAAARRAAAAVGVRLAGVDIVTDDAGVPLESSGGAILEVNPVPGLIHHASAQRDAGPPKAAVAILAALLHTERRSSA